MKRNKLGRTKYQHGGMGYVDGIETEKKKRKKLMRDQIYFDLKIY